MSEPIKKVRVTVTVTDGWLDRVADLLVSIAASTPDDHPWVQEARWLLENGPKGVLADAEEPTDDG